MLGKIKEARELFHHVESPTGYAEALYEIFYQKIHEGEIQPYGKPKVLDFTIDPETTENNGDANAQPSGDGGSEQDDPGPNPGESRSGKTSRAKSKRPEASTGTLPVQQPDDISPTE